MPAKVLIVDDHVVVREGLKIILETTPIAQVVGEAADGHSALEKACELRPDIIVMDISMPELNGVEATRRICKILPSVRIIILSMHNDNEHVSRAVQAGARAYILKESAGSCVVNAIRAVMNGNYYFGEGVDEPQKSRSGKWALFKSPIDDLSQRERETLQLVVEGNSNSDIAKILNISSKSVETYRSRLSFKLGISNLPDLVRFALKNGIISLN